MHYTPTALGKIERQISNIRFKYYDLVMHLGAFSRNMKHPRAIEYMTNGVTRRLFIINRCVENIFRLFPPSRAERLPEEDRLDLEISLHAFLINAYGIIENLALALAFENGLISNAKSERQSTYSVGLFKDDFKKQLSPRLRIYLSTSKIRTWYCEYAKNFRDALAHRIPPYVPPSGLNKRDQKRFKKLSESLGALSKQGYSERYSVIMDELVSLGKASPFYVHSFSEKARLVYLHPQVIADFMTLEELILKVIKYFYVKQKKGITRNLKSNKSLEQSP